MRRLQMDLPVATRQRGMTLVEILVAIVVLSVGLLGLAGLQLKGMQVNQGSAYRWQAALLVEDIADRMRADRTSAQNGQYNVTGGVPATTGSSTTQSVLQDWWSRVQAQLPGAQATIGPVAPGATANSFSIPISVTWNDTRAQGGSGLSPTNNSTAYNTPGSYSVTLGF
jgi:type IV pilus assembly protein PilV